MSSDTAVCKTCGIEKPLSMYTKDRGSRYKVHCKQCRALAGRKYARENWSIVYASQRKWSENNRDKMKEKHKRSYARRRESIIAWQISHAHKRRASSGEYTKESLESRYAMFGNRCAYCNQDTDLSIDHVIPLSRGGTNWPANIRPACKSCNSRKSNKPWREFLVSLP